MILRVDKVVLIGVNLRELRTHFDAQQRGGLQMGAEYHMSDGLRRHKTTGRIGDFRDVDLCPVLDQNAQNISFVEGPVVDRARINLVAFPQLLSEGRVQLIAEEKIDWENLPFGLNQSDSVYVAKVNAAKGQAWVPGNMFTYQTLGIDPAAVCLNYGQEIFEGAKVYVEENGDVLAFRLEENALRFQRGAARLSMPPVPVSIFVEAVKRTVKANKRLLPPAGIGQAAMYVRPALIGSGPQLGVKAATEYTFYVFVSPVGPYFKGGFSAIDLVVEDHYHRSGPGITGDVKAGGNYAPGILVAKLAKERDRSVAEAIYLDVVKNQYVNEVGAANFFAVKRENGRAILYTPKLDGTILPGITRDSVIQLARHLGHEVWEMDVPIDFVMGDEVVEAFCTGTAAVISPIGAIKRGKQEKVYNNRQPGEITMRLYDMLTQIQRGKLVVPEFIPWVTKLITRRELEA